MKRLAIVVIVLVVLGGITYFYSSVEYTAPNEKEVKEVTVEVDALQKRIDDAIASSSMQTEAKAYNTYLETREQLEKEIELKVTREYREEIEQKEAKLEETVSL